MKKRRKDWSRRRLEVTTGGKWYLVLTLMLGFLAMTGTNSILYLLESFLLGALILSGLVSDLFVVSLEVEWVVKKSFAGEIANDVWKLSNRGRLPVFGIEFGAWRDKGGRERAGWISVLWPGQSYEVRSEAVLTQRGRGEWSGHYCSTSAPFGFARKVRIFNSSGHRWVWPERKLRPKIQLQAFDNHGRAQRALARSGIPTERAPGDVRQWNASEDARDIVWSLSAREDALVARVRQFEKPHGQKIILIDLDTDQSTAFFEDVFKAVAHEIERHRVAGLRIVEGGVSRDFYGRLPMLDALAEVKPPKPTLESAA